MDVGQVQSQDELQRMMQQQASGTGKPPPPPDGKMPPPMGDQFSKSELAELVTSGELEESDLETLHAFGKEIADSMAGGTFNAEKLAENAPEALQTLAESKGMTVEELVEEMANSMAAFLENKPANGAYGAPPPPPPDGMMPGLGAEETDDEVTQADA